MGIGVQGEPCRVVAQDAGDRLGVHAVLDGQRCVGVAQVVEADILGDARFLAEGLVEPPYAVGTVHLPGDRGGKHDRVEGVLPMLLDQQLHRLLGEKHLADAVGRLGWADPHLALKPSRRFRDGQDLAFYVQVAPLKCHQLAPAQTSGQLQIEHSQHPMFFGGGQIVLDLLRREDVHLPLFLGRQAAGRRWVVGNEPLQYRLIETLTKHGVDSSNGADAERSILHALVLLHPARLPGMIVELLEVQGGEFVQLDRADAGDYMVLDQAAVIFGGGVLDGGLTVDLMPEPAPVGHGILPGLGHIDLLVFLHGGLELFLDLGLGLAQHVLVDGFTGRGITTCCVPSLPPPVFPFADAALAVGALLSHLLHLRQQGTPP